MYYWKCSPNSLANEIRQIAPPNVTFICESPSFEELAHYIRKSAFVLAPYCPDSVLSSGILMDSLSFGSKIIGPEVGSFKDYAREKRLNVYTFHDYEDIEKRSPAIKRLPYPLKTIGAF